MRNRYFIVDPSFGIFARGAFGLQPVGLKSFAMKTRARRFFEKATLSYERSVFFSFVNCSPPTSCKRRLEIAAKKPLPNAFFFKKAYNFPMVGSQDFRFCGIIIASMRLLSVRTGRKRSGSVRQNSADRVKNARSGTKGGTGVPHSAYSDANRT